MSPVWSAVSPCCRAVPTMSPPWQPPVPSWRPSGRNVYHLTTLLRQGAVEAALRYRETFEALVGDVHRHLKVAADALADMRPNRAVSPASRPITKGDEQHGCAT